MSCPVCQHRRAECERCELHRRRELAFIHQATQRRLEARIAVLEADRARPWTTPGRGAGKTTVQWAEVSLLLQDYRNNQSDHCTLCSTWAPISRMKPCPKCHTLRICKVHTGEDGCGNCWEAPQCGNCEDMGCPECMA